MTAKHCTKRLYLCLVYLLLYTPLIILLLFSFNSAKHSLIWHGFTWHWYRDLFANEILLKDAWHSLMLATLCAFFATTIGTLGGVAFYKYRFYGKSLLHTLIVVLVIIPDLVLAISLLLLFTFVNIHLGFMTLLLAHVTFCIPFVVVIIYSRLHDFDHNILKAARDLGANDYIIFWQIILPLAKPAVFAAWLLSFALSIDDVIISFFVAGPNFQILPLYIFSEVKIGPTPEINALCTILLLLTFVMVFCGQLLLKKKP